MIVKGYKTDGNWVYTEWEVTVPMGWKQIVYAMDAIVNIVKDSAVFVGKSGCALNDITNEVQAVGNSLIQVGLLMQENDVLKIRGTMLGVPIDLTLQAEAEFAQVTFLLDDVIPEGDSDVTVWLYDTFGALLNKMELIGHVNSI